MSDEKPKPRLSKLAVLSLVIPSFLTLAPRLLLLLFNFLFGPYPSDGVQAALTRIAAALHLSFDNAVSIPPLATVFLAVLLPVTAIVRLLTSRGSLYGYLWPTVSLLLIPLYFLGSFVLTVILLTELF